jgi:hypothetical protein
MTGIVMVRITLAAQDFVGKKTGAWLKPRL